MAEQNIIIRNQKKWLKVLQIFAAYLVAAWTFLGFVDWIINRYQISPYWVDLWLWFFVGIIPSLLIYLYHQDRINTGILHLREKIVFPLNVLVIAIGLYVGFGTSDLGATNKEIEFTREDGTVLRREITKDEFRIGIPIFNFKQTDNDSTTLWLEKGIRNLLFYDMHQDKNVNPSAFYAENTTDKVQAAKLFHDLYVDGKYTKKDGLYTVTPSIRESKNGKLMASESFTGPELAKILDSISIYIRDQVGVTEKQRAQYVDLEIQEFTSNSFKAIEHFVQGEYQEAIAIDSTFALAHLNQAARNIRYSRGKFEEQFTIERAFDNRSKLPEDRQLQILIYRHIAYEDWQKAEDLVKLQLEIEPNNEVYVNLRYQIYSETKQLKPYLEFAKARFDKELNESTGESFIEALIINGEYRECIDALDKFLLFKPNDKNVFFFKFVPEILNVELKEARATLKKAILLHPEWENITKVHDSTLRYLEANSIDKTDLSFFEGDFRSLNSEQEYRIWMHNEALLFSASNQMVKPVIPSGKTKLTIVLHQIGGLSTADYLQNEVGETFAIQFEQYNWDISWNYFAFKLDESIKKATALLVKEDLENAQTAYIKAIENNPEHFYLKDALAHINYMKQTDSLDIQQQFREVEGTYGPRKFWVEKGKLFYKRSGDANLPRVQLLPISNSRYMNLTKMDANAVFEYKEGKAIASYFWTYDMEKKEWVKLDDERNYFEKD